MAKRRMELLDAARGPNSKAKTRLHAYGEVAQMQPDVVAKDGRWTYDLGERLVRTNG